MPVTVDNRLPRGLLVVVIVLLSVVVVLTGLLGWGLINTVGGTEPRKAPSDAVSNAPGPDNRVQQLQTRANP
jgi:hypothetical protein